MSLFAKSDTDLVCDASSQLERLLEERLGATGKGLHEKASSVQARLSPEALKRIRFIASVRNAVVHERVPVKDRMGFMIAVDGAAAEIGALAPAERAGRADPADTRWSSVAPWLPEIGIGAFTVLGAVAGYSAWGVGGAILTGVVSFAAATWVAMNLAAIAGFAILGGLVWAAVALWNWKIF
jgi:hypothetical protein